MQSAAVLNLDLGAARRAFRYRKGTRDEVAVVQALKESGYNFRALRRGDELSELYERLSESGKTPLIIDAGANIGASTIYFAFSFPKAKVVALEPEASDFELLSANVDGLPIERLHARLAGAMASAAGGSRTDENAPPLVTVGALLDRFAADATPFILKLDADRSEADVFDGSPDWIARMPVIIVALHDILILGSDNVRKFVKAISRHDRDFVYLQDNIFSIRRDLQ